MSILITLQSVPYFLDNFNKFPLLTEVFPDISSERKNLHRLLHRYRLFHPRISDSEISSSFSRIFRKSLLVSSIFAESLSNAEG